MVIEKSGKVNIVIPGKSDTRVSYAATALANYTEKITGAPSQMCTEEQDGVNFILCTKKSAPGSERADIPGKLTRPEGIYIKIKDDTALICGSDERGLIYSVYEFLESYAHCCFAAYSSPD